MQADDGRLHGFAKGVDTTLPFTHSLLSTHPSLSQDHTSKPYPGALIKSSSLFDASSRAATPLRFHSPKTLALPSARRRRSERPPLPPSAMATQISKKKKVRDLLLDLAGTLPDGVFYAELNEMLTRELAEDGYSGVEVRVTPMRTEIIIRATRTQNVLGEKGRRIRELTSVVQKRFNFPENGVELYAEKVVNRGLCAIAQAESLRYKLLGGLAVRRAKSMKFKDGYMISSGQPVNEYIDSAGVLGIKVKIMLDWDPKGKVGPITPLPDLVTIHAPKEEDELRPPVLVPEV
ncbi:hypothetical protein HU200_028780 [Digitaria exilis]|uniref:KH type-2 domain-containing protein n=1 Tax=Digitaria exilis TaxID=1010633 RepID=A0A835ESP5_9POAL|nr:hypothetical protein HU200_028780 [Digitaria exilis]